MAQRAQEPIAGTPPLTIGTKDPNRLIALEIRSRKVGFAVFDGPTKLLDWGVRWFGTKNGSLRATVSNRLRALLNLHRPYVLIARTRKYRAVAGNKRFATILGAIRTEAERHSAKVILLTSRHVQQHFALNGRVSKHAIATKIADQFEELSWKLPGPRKSYQSEAPIMVVFDAAATGVVLFGKTVHQDSGNSTAP